MRAGRKPASQSRATEIRQRLLQWRQEPEQQRISLRALAIELGTSHQLLSSYLDGLTEWQSNEQSKEYRHRADAIRQTAEKERRELTAWEWSQLEALDRAAFDCKIESVLASIVRRYEKELRAGAKLNRSGVRLLRVLAQRGFPGASELLETYGLRRLGQEKRNLPWERPCVPKSFKRA